MRAALGSSYSGLEEGQFTLLICIQIPNISHWQQEQSTGKADVMGIYNILFMVKKGLIPKEMTNKVITFVWYSQ